MSELRDTIERLYEVDADELQAELRAEAEAAFVDLRNRLSRGEVRAAEPRDGEWAVNGWVKKGILLGFRLGRVRDFSINDDFRFFDKHTLPTGRLEPDDGVRVVPGGSSIRAGAHVGRDVVCMPPMYINVGAWVGDGTMIDSHALVGSCAQVGERVHVSAGAQIGGVLEPVRARPVILEEGVLVGGNCGVYEGTLVRAGAVIAAGTVLTASTPVYDLVREEVLRGSADEPLTVPEGAVVVPGSRPAGGAFAGSEGIHLYTPVIVKYRDPDTDAATALEEALREGP